MKITDKIVTQVGQPSMTNVVWHNPDTNELKMYSKNGWEVVGDNAYPIVIIKPTTNTDGTTSATIEMQPFTYYKVACDNLTVKASAALNNVAVEYVVDATCGSIVWDFPVYWNNNVEPTVDVNTRNVFSIVDGIATFTTVSMSE